MADNKINVGGRLHSIATGNVLAGANEILDDSKNKKQSDINAETDAALEDRYTKEQTYSKPELNNLITTPNQQYVSVTANSQTTTVTDVLPATGAANTVYRVGNWDGSQFDASVYSEYAWNGNQYVHLSTKTKIGEVFDISAYHATGGTLATYADLSAALDFNNGGGVPQSLQKGGMSIKFVQSSDNKYVQARLMAQNFTTDVTQWQVVESEPRYKSHNLVESGALFERTHLVDIAKQRSRNLFNPAWYSTDVTIDNDGWYVCANNKMQNITCDFIGESETQYTFSVLVKGGSEGTGRIYFRYTDSTYTRVGFIATAVDTLITLTSTAGKTISSITFDYGGNVAAGVNLNYFKNVQLEKGVVATDYVPYYSIKDILLERKIDGYNYAIPSYAYDSYKQFASKNLYTREGIKLQNNGLEGSNASYNTTDYIFIPKGRTIYIRLKCSNSGICSLFKYDIEKNPVMPVYSGVIDVNTTFTAAEDCYIKSCQNVTDINHSTNPSYLHLMENGNVLERLSDVQNYLYPCTYDSWKYFAPRDIYTVENVAISSNGIEIEKNNYNSTPFIFIPKGATIYLRLRSDNLGISSLYKYDIDRKRVAGIYTGIVDVETTYTATEDCYIRSSQYKTFITASNNPSYIHLIKKDNVPNRLDAVQNSLPDYWNDYLKTKEGEIASLVANTGNHGDLFIYFSDYHIQRNTNPCLTPRIIQNLFNWLGRLKVFCGGDLISQESTRLAAMELMQQYMADFKGIDLYNVFGNHDGNDYGTEDAKLTIDYHYPILFKYLENNPHVTATGKDYYYLDYDFHKIRYIFLNTYDNGYYLNREEHVEQINWFINVLNSVEDGWYVVVLPHIFYEISTSGDEPSLYRQRSGLVIGAITDAYQLKQSSSYTYEGVTISFDFTNAHGKVAAIITGHVHYDYIEQTAAGYPIITIEQDAIGYPGAMPQPTRTLGTYTEQAFDIMSIDLVGKTIKTVRIGSGENRTCTFV